MLFNKICVTLADILSGLTANNLDAKWIRPFMVRDGAVNCNDLFWLSITSLAGLQHKSLQAFVTHCLMLTFKIVEFEVNCQLAMVCFGLAQ
jgi:hypothetical protein